MYQVEPKRVSLGSGKGNIRASLSLHWGREDSFLLLEALPEFKPAAGSSVGVSGRLKPKEGVVLLKLRF